MPLEDGLVIAIRRGVLELTATLRHPQDPPESLAQAVATRLREHRLLAMTDPHLIDGDDLRVASVLSCREPIPEDVQAKLLELGLSPEATESGGRTGGWLNRALGKRPVRLDRWRMDYARAAELRPELGYFERACAEAADDYESYSDALASAVTEAADRYLRVIAPPTLDGVAALERALDVKAQHRLVFHPGAVSALAAFVAQAIRGLRSDWVVDPEGDWPLTRQSPGEPPKGTDPAEHVAEHFRVGSRSSLSQYVHAL